MKKYCLILILILNAVAVKPQFRTETEYLNFEGYDRSWEIFIPESYSPEKNYPLVFILHGGGGNAKGLIRTTRHRFNSLANRDGFIAVYPSGIGKSWNDGARDTFGIARKMKVNDVGFFVRMLNVIQTYYSIDSGKIFACGISNGGFMAQRLAFELSDKIKGIGVVAANLSVVQSQKKYPENPVPAIFINGTDDPLIPYSGGPVTVFRQERGMVLSVENTIEIWKEINGCTEKECVFSYPDKNNRDNCKALKSVWINPAESRLKVVEIKVENGGHTWPGTKQYLPLRLVGNTNFDFNGCDEIWDFFKSLI